MGRFFHRLRANKTSQWPRNWCWVDTETLRLGVDAKTEKQVLRLGVACYHRDSFGGHPTIDVWWTFKTPRDFWDRLITESELDRRVIVMAYNAGFDMRILETYAYLVPLGYVPGNLFNKGQVLIADIRRDKHRIVILDAMNYFLGKLEQWGKWLGLPKYDVDFANVSDADLTKHCEIDVRILRELWLQWRWFITKYNLGCFAPTKSAQALNAFRHRFMACDIYIHANEKAGRIERRSYYGGRTECFRIGKCTGGPFYKVDVNCMYADIMRTLSLPVKLLRVVSRCKVSQLRKALKTLGAIAKVTIETDEPCYPFRRPDNLIFPIGTFRVYLAGPELNYAIASGHLKAVHKVALYDREVVFSDYVETLYPLRLKFKAEGNKVFEKCVKYLLINMHGKFGQRNETWNCLGRTADAVDGVYTYCDSDTGKITTRYVVAGYTHELVSKQDAHHSFHAISSYITSGARQYLWSLIKQAGRSNVFYCDTDSLIVNATGYANLTDRLDATRLGALKLEYATKLLRIHGAKDYQTGKEKHIKGVPKAWHRTGPGRYTGYQWEGVRGAIRQGNMDCVMMKRMDKHLKREYTKGQVSDSGSVSPIVLSGETAFSRC